MLVAGLLAATFLAGSWTQRQAHLRSESISVPVPRKAAVALAWVESLRARRAEAEMAGSACGIVLRASVEEWERAWLSFLPMIAWDTPIDLRRVAVILPSDEAGAVEPCAFVATLGHPDVVTPLRLVTPSGS